MKNVLLDTNIILDIALKREPFFNDSVQIFSLIDSQVISGFVTASTITDIYYISKKEQGHGISISFIKSLMEVIEVVGIDKDIILNAISSDSKDFEDAIQISAAEMNGIETIITRNKKDFSNSLLEIYTPTEFIKSV
jgi:predicted nucleic acid-binding protein